jgi:predicted metal-binding protein
LQINNPTEIISKLKKKKRKEAIHFTVCGLLPPISNANNTSQKQRDNGNSSLSLINPFKDKNGNN